MRSPEDLAEGLRARARRFARFAAWESTHRAQPTPAAAVASVGAIYALLPPSSRRRAVDPTGVRRMHDALRRLVR
jgi:hypothetical protein